MESKNTKQAGAITLENNKKQVQFIKPAE